METETKSETRVADAQASAPRKEWIPAQTMDAASDVPCRKHQALGQANLPKAADSMEAPTSEGDTAPRLHDGASNQEAGAESGSKIPTSEHGDGGKGGNDGDDGGGYGNDDGDDDDDDGDDDDDKYTSESEDSDSSEEPSGLRRRMSKHRPGTKRKRTPARVTSAEASREVTTKKAGTTRTENSTAPQNRTAGTNCRGGNGTSWMRSSSSSAARASSVTDSSRSRANEWPRGSKRGCEEGDGESDDDDDSDGYDVNDSDEGEGEGEDDDGGMGEGDDAFEAHESGGCDRGKGRGASSSRSEKPQQRKSANNARRRDQDLEARSAQASHRWFATESTTPPSRGSTRRGAGARSMSTGKWGKEPRGAPPIATAVCRPGFSKSNIVTSMTTTTAMAQGSRVAMPATAPTSTTTAAIREGHIPPRKGKRYSTMRGEARPSPFDPLREAAGVASPPPGLGISPDAGYMMATASRGKLGDLMGYIWSRLWIGRETDIACLDAAMDASERLIKRDQGEREEDGDGDGDGEGQGEREGEEADGGRGHRGKRKRSKEATTNAAVCADCVVGLFQVLLAQRMPDAVRFIRAIDICCAARRAHEAVALASAMHSCGHDVTEEICIRILDTCIYADRRKRLPTLVAKGLAGRVTGIPSFEVSRQEVSRLLRQAEIASRGRKRLPFSASQKGKRGPRRKFSAGARIADGSGSDGGHRRRPIAAARPELATPSESTQPAEGEGTTTAASGEALSATRAGGQRGNRFAKGHHPGAARDHQRDRGDGGWRTGARHQTTEEGTWVRADRAKACEDGHSATVDSAATVDVAESAESGALAASGGLPLASQGGGGTEVSS